MSQIGFEEEKSPDVEVLPLRRGFQPRTIQEIRKERGQEYPEDSGAPVSAPLPASAPMQQPPVAEPPAPRTPSTLFRRNAPEQRQTVRKAPPVSTVPSVRVKSSFDLKSMVVEDVRRFPVWPALLAVFGAVIFGIILFAAFSLGEHRGRIAAARELTEAQAKSGAAPTDLDREEVRLRLDKALSLTRSGDPEGGWKAIRGISREYSHVPSLAYAEALVALQAQQYTEALDLTKISISRGQRIADSLALQAALNESSPLASGAVQEELLRKASNADPMNPYPILQLALFFGTHGDDAQAESLLRSAKLRLLPVDSHAVVDSSLAMVKLRHLPAGSLPPGGEPTGIAEKDFPTAYAAMRRGDFQTAATILEITRKSVPPELFDYLLSASPIRDYALEPKITRFY